MDSRIYAIPISVMRGTGEALFDHIAGCLSDFVHDRDIADETLPLGFTFSFPCRQEGLAKATLVQWTKGCRCDDGRPLFMVMQMISLI